MSIERKLLKVAEELETSPAIAAEEVLTKVAFARELLRKPRLEKTAAPTVLETAGRVGRTLGTALIAGIGLGLAGEAISAGHKKIKEMLFEKNLNQLAKEVKKVNPSLANASENEIKTMLRAGYTLAPEIMENPTLAASFVSIGHSLGGQIDPNTIKTFADANAKAGHKDNIVLESVMGPGLNLGRN